VTDDLLRDFEVALVGRGCQIERRAADWAFSFEDAGHLNTDSPWRLVVEERIAVADEDDGQMFGLGQPVDATGRANALLAAEQVATVQVDRVTADIRILFESGLRLDIFNISSGHEAWQAKFPRGDQTVTLVGMGGGRVAFFIAQTDAPPQIMTMQLLERDRD
jgi:hypothetical protein